MARKVMVNGLDIGYVPPTSAQDIVYDNTSSGLASTTIQGAVDEVAESLDLASTAVLAAGATTVSFSDARIKTTSIIDPWQYITPDGTAQEIIAPTHISVSSGQCTLTFEAQANAVTVGVRVF